MWKPALVSLSLLAAVACNRRDPSPAPPAPARAPVRAPAAEPGARPGGEVPAGMRHELVSGRSLGPVRLGMTLAEVRSMGAVTEESRRGDEAHYRMPNHGLSLSLRGDRVVRVSVSVEGDAPTVALGNLAIRPNTSMETITAALPGCGPIELNRGGTVSVCHEGRTRVMRVGPPGVLTLEVREP